jgi:hypothetical protein
MCEELVDKQLLCGHIKKGCKCYINLSAIRCEEINIILSHFSETFTSNLVTISSLVKIL